MSSRSVAARVVLAVAAAASVATTRDEDDPLIVTEGPEISVRRGELATATVSVDVPDGSGWGVVIDVDPRAGRFLGNPEVRTGIFDADSGELQEYSDRALYHLVETRACDVPDMNCSATLELEWEVEQGAEARVAWTVSLYASESDEDAVTLTVSAP